MAPSELKNRVNACLNKLSDRDTVSIATSELESIAKTLSDDGFAPFLTCLSTTDSSDKSPVRRQCVRLLSVLSAAHGDALSPHLTKLMTALLRRLRDSDSSVRSACISASSSISSHVTKPPFSLILKPLLDSLLHEQDYNVQIGASLCLAAAIEAAPEPDTAELKKLLPRLIKLVKNDCFKAKPALLTLITSIIAVGAASSKNVLTFVVPCVIEFLSSDDWALRKSAAEALEKLALVERDSLSDFKDSCIDALENKRFDKVKGVREIMNRALVIWKEVPGVSVQSKSSPRDIGTGASSPIPCETSSDVDFRSPIVKKGNAASRSPSSTSSSVTPLQKISPLLSDRKNSSSAKSYELDSRKPSNWKTDVTLRRTLSGKVTHDDDQKGQDIKVSDLTGNGRCRNINSETKRVLFNKSADDRLRKSGGSKYSSRVVPFFENDNCELDLAHDTAVKEARGSQKEFEDVTLIQKQLVQIENQQSNLLDLMQKFIGSSQNGMNYLEKRVNGLERAIDEMSHDLAMSTRRTENTDSAGNACCMLPGAEFLSPKFWRKGDGQSSNSRISLDSRRQPQNTINSMLDKEAFAESTKTDSQKNQNQSRNASFVDPKRDSLQPSILADSNSNRRMKKMNRDNESVQVYSSRS